MRKEEYRREEDNAKENADEFNKTLEITEENRGVNKRIEKK